MSDFSYEYLPLRGITKSTFEFYNAITKIDGDGKPVSLGFKYPSGAYKVRNLTEKGFHWEGESTPGLFGRDRFAPGSASSVTITEGELDALSLYQVLRTPVVSVQSSGTGSRDCAVDRSWLNSFERVYLALDQDGPGRDCAAEIAKLFEPSKVYLVRFDRDGRKDANDYLQAGEQDELRTIWKNSKHYVPASIESHLEDFKRILTEPRPPSLPYPFRKWTEMTYGIRTGESVLITAQEKVGKTEVMHTLLHHILRSTDDNVGAIFLEEPKRDLLTSIAGIEIKKPARLPDSGVTTGEIISALESVVQRDERLHIYSHFGSSAADDLLDTIRFLVVARACRYILLDHITMAVSGLGGEDERRALDYLSTRLEMMVKELDFSLIFVSHVNDHGQTRGSRYISKVCDTRIDLSRDMISSDPAIRNTINVSIPYNRFGRNSGPAGFILYDMKTGLLHDPPMDFMDAVVESPSIVTEGELDGLRSLPSPA